MANRKDFWVYRKGMTDAMLVRDLMTPAVFSVSSNRPADQVVEQMLAFKVHRLFVVDSTGVLIGVITALDILRHLQHSSSEASE